MDNIRKRRGLKPCPWCGFSPNLIEDKLWTEHSYDGRTITHGYVGSYKYYYQCSNKECNAIAPYGKYDTICYSIEEAKQYAKDAWQRRANDE